MEGMMGDFRDRDGSGEEPRDSASGEDWRSDDPRDVIEPVLTERVRDGTRLIMLLNDVDEITSTKRLASWRP